MSTLAQKAQLIELAQKTYGILSLAATEKRTVPYTTLATALGSPSVGQLADVLQAVMEECKSKREPLLSALVVNREGVPGEGFFKAARGLGYEVEHDPESEKAFWLWHLQRMGIYDVIFEAQQPAGSPLTEALKTLKLVGYHLEFEPLYPGEASKSYLKGRQLVKVSKVVDPEHPDQPISVDTLTVLQDSNYSLVLTKERPLSSDPGTAAIQSLRQTLQRMALEKLAGGLQTQEAEPEASSLPSGD